MTEYVEFSDTVIREAAVDDFVRDLRDRRYPGLRLRFRGDRRYASWDLRQDGKWRKVGNWPQIEWKAMHSALPGYELALGLEGKTVRLMGEFVTVGDLLTWHLERQLNNAELSKLRKAVCRSMFRRWLLPHLGMLPLAEVNRATVDRLLIQPMQAKLKPASVCNCYRMLLAAIHAARRLELLTRNPLEGVMFPDFGLRPIRPKEARLLPKDAGAVASLLAERFASAPRDCMLALLMLLHGTRVGETRRARWVDFDLDAGWLVIPADLTKTRTQHEIPLTPGVVALVRRYRETRGEKRSVYLFPGGGGRPLSAQGAAQAIQMLSGGAWSSHDLRKLARAGWAEQGVDYLVGELLLNHAPPGLASTYIQTDLAQKKREALEGWHGAGNGRSQGLDLSSRFEWFIRFD
ncbi:tyrosine-type recombinase/integrase [Pseudomonas marincola]|nr:site-specific integrase [Pseudomonas marincola]